MAELKTYRVNRRLDGDRLYEDGDTRQLTAADAKPLVDSGALTLVAEAPNVETPAPAPIIAETPAVTADALVPAEPVTSPAIATKQGRARG